MAPRRIQPGGIGACVSIERPELRIAQHAGRGIRCRSEHGIRGLRFAGVSRFRWLAGSRWDECRRAAVGGDHCHRGSRPQPGRAGDARRPRRKRCPLFTASTSAPGTAGYSAYTSVYHDIGNDGYGYTTGLGSPHVANVLNLLGAAPTTTTPTITVPSPVSVSFISTLPSTVVTGTSSIVKLKLTTTSGYQFTGPVSINLYASSDNTNSSDDTLVGSVTLPHLSLRALGTRVVAIRANYASNLAAGAYFFVASASASATDDSQFELASATSFIVQEPTVDLATAFASANPISVIPGHSDEAIVTITNTGNTIAKGIFNLSLYASADELLDRSDTLLTGVNKRAIRLRPGHSITLHLHFTAPADATPGSCDLIASTTSITQLADGDASNDTATIPTA